MKNLKKAMALVLCALTISNSLPVFAASPSSSGNSRTSSLDKNDLKDFLKTVFTIGGIGTLAFVVCMGIDKFANGDDDFSNIEPFSEDEDDYKERKNVETESESSVALPKVGEIMSSYKPKSDDKSKSEPRVNTARLKRVVKSKPINLLKDAVEFEVETHENWPSSAFANGGNTCYFASAIQVLYSFNRFRNMVLGNFEQITDNKQEAARLKKELSANENYLILRKLFVAMGEKKIIKSAYTRAFAEKLAGHTGRTGDVKEAISEILTRTSLDQKFPYLMSECIDGNLTANYIVGGSKDSKRTVLKRVIGQQQHLTDLSLNQYMIFLEHNFEKGRIVLNEYFGVKEVCKQKGEDYRLVSIAVHTGTDHYIAFKRNDAGKWCLFSDGYVREFDGYEDMLAYSIAKEQNIHTHSMIAVYEK